jgi:signal transduction histidine kinase
MGMSIQIPITEFAPAERVPIEVIQRQAAEVMNSPIRPTLANATMQLVFILNQQRQIVFASQNWEKLTGVQDCNCLLGQRPGEALHCIHASELEGGCGTTEYCRECGAIRAILKSLSGTAAIEECRLTRLINCNSEALDLLVYASPFTYNGEVFSIVSATDISHQKRRRALERIFFHDVINSAGGLEGLAEILEESAPQEMRGDLSLLKAGLHSMVEEILTQKDLAAAENSELQVHLQPYQSRELLERSLSALQYHPVAEGRNLILYPRSASVSFITDGTLLKRILENLIKNALEATPMGGAITAGCDTDGKDINFWVANIGVMPRETQLQVFERSYSTKGEGRGLGTYSAKLLTERYLRGRIDFFSTPNDGTRFTVTLPFL